MLFYLFNSGYLTGQSLILAEVAVLAGVPGDFCTSVDATNWYERSLEWHEGRSTLRSRS
jgi:hypothetical protein